MNNRLIWTVAFLLCAIMAQAQNETDILPYLQRAGDHAALYQGRILTSSYITEWVAHPYWKDKEFHPGQVSFSGTLYPQVMMRYDIHNQKLEVMSPVRRFIILPDQGKIDYFILEGKRFVRKDDRFVAVEYESDGIRLEHLIDKIRTTDVHKDGHAKKNLQTRESYQLIDAEGSHEVKNLKSMTRLYPQFKGALDAYSNEHKLRFKGNSREEALRQSAAYLGSLLPSEQTSATHQVPAALTVSIPDSLTENVTSEVPAYSAFRQGSTERVVAEPEGEEQTGEAGISDLKPLTEDRILDEVEVTAFRSKVFMSQMGVDKFRPAQLRNMPMAFGEADVLKMVQSLPGVKTMGEASSGFNVRGGASDQNLILLGGGTVYNPMHMFGLFSAFNTDAINDAELYKSSIPSQYGGRISSVMNISTRSADKQQFHGSASIGLLTSKAHLEIPLAKDKLSLLLAARTTYSDWMLKLLPDDSDYKQGKAGFYDLNGTLSWTMNERHFLKIFGYYSHDRFSFTPDDKYGYNNGNGSMEWKAYWTENLSSVITAGIDHYDYLNDETGQPTIAARLSFNINESYLKGLFSLKAGEKNTWQWGWNSLLYSLCPGKYEPLGQKSNINFNKLETVGALESALFAEDEWAPTEKVKLNAGVRLNLFNSLQEEKKKTYFGPEMRLSASYTLTPNSSIKAGFNTMHQYIHKVSNTVIMSPTDTWILSNAAIKPQSGWQAATGYYLQTENRKFELSAELYYKQMSNYLTWRSAGQLVMNPNLENDVIAAKGRAYGIEVMLRKPIGKLNGWLSYTYSRTFLRQNDKNLAQVINEGDWFPADCDRPHEFKFVGNYKITRRFSFSLNMDYSTGRPTTVPAGQYYNRQKQRYEPYYTRRNGHRIPDYFRMDASFNIEPTHHQTKKTHSWFSIGVYNMLGRKNAYSVYYESGKGRIQGYKLSIFGAPIPFVSYNIKF